jgi:hypothetical protein
LTPGNELSWTLRPGPAGRVGALVGLTARQLALRREFCSVWMNIRTSGTRS